MRAIRKNWRMSSLITFTVLMMVAGVCTGRVVVASAAEWPSQDITIIVAGPPGGGFDLVARATAPSIGKNLPKRVGVVVKNNTAAAGKAAIMELVKAKPDGYTVAVFDPQNITLARMGKQLEGLDIENIAWLARLNVLPDLLVVGEKTGLKNPAQMKGKTLRFAVHQAGEMVRALIMGRALGVTVQFVNYAGAPEACLAIMRGDCDAILFNWASLMRQVRASGGRLIPFLLTADERDPGLDVPTHHELGIKIEGAISSSSKVLAVPPGLPQEIRRIWEETILKIFNDPGWSAQMNKAGFPPTPLIRDKLQSWIREDLENLEKNKDIVNAVFSGK